MLLNYIKNTKNIVVIVIKIDYNYKNVITNFDKSLSD